MRFCFSLEKLVDIYWEKVFFVPFQIEFTGLLSYSNGNVVDFVVIFFQLVSFYVIADSWYTTSLMYSPRVVVYVFNDCSF